MPYPLDVDALINDLMPESDPLFVPIGLMDQQTIAGRLSNSTKRYQQDLADLIDLLQDDGPVTVTQLSAHHEAWLAYYESSLEFMRVTISAANAKRRERKTKK